MEILTAGKYNIDVIAGFLKDGQVLICPTDTVYGLICDASNEKAVEKIFEIKKREKSKPLGIFVKDLAAAKETAFVGEGQEKYLEDNHVTSILKAKKESLSKLIYKDSTIGIRIPKYEFLNLVLEKFGKPIAQTSANFAGSPASTKILDIKNDFENENVIIIDGGDLPENAPSKIIDLTKNSINILRK